MRVLGSRYHMVGLEHLNYCTPASLKMLLQRVGFVMQTYRTCGFNPLIFWKDLRGRHLSGRFSPNDLLQDQRQNADLRKNPVVRFLQKMADLAVAPILAGDLLIMTAQK